ncbi:hypothetical protein ACP70R_038487 [Stipagrostis hirtigluma subsp. patula]
MSLEPLPQETTGRPPSRPPEERTADEAGDGAVCTALCMYLPRRSKKKRPVKPTAGKSARKASWSWWPWSPSHPDGGDAAAAEPPSSTPDVGEGSASFRHWGRSQLSRVTPQGPSSPSSSFSFPSSSFSFPSSPASASSGVSTPKLGQSSKAEEAGQWKIWSEARGRRRIRRHGRKPRWTSSAPCSTAPTRSRTAPASPPCAAPWRRAVVELHPPQPPPPPWLLLPDFKLSSLSSDGATATGHRVPLPEGVIPNCIGSTCDGRVVCRTEQRCFLLNPLSGATTPLPELDLDGPRKKPPFTWGFNMNLYRPSMPRKVVFSAPPDSGGGSACIAAGISGFGSSSGFDKLTAALRTPYETSRATLFLCRPGAAAAAWSMTTDICLKDSSDIAFHDGKLYLFSKSPSPRLYAFDLREDDGGALRVTRVAPIDGLWWLSPREERARQSVASAFFYLVESRGTLLLVQRDFRERRTREVAVFAMVGSSTTPRRGWVRVQSLEGEMIFLSANSAVSVPSSRYGGARGDRICFSEEMYLNDAEECPRQKHCRHQHCEVFDMMTRTVETMCMGTAPGHGDYWCSTPTWFVPSHQKQGNLN